MTHPVRRQRVIRLPRPRPLVEPISSARAGFFRSGGFYFRVSALAALAIGVFGFLALRLWSLQVLQGPRYANVAQRQTFRFVDLPAPRGAIVDDRGKLLAGAMGRLVLTADPATLGNSKTSSAAWKPSPAGRYILGKVARRTGTPVRVLVARITRSLLRSPFAPAVVIPRLDRRTAFYLDERAAAFPGVQVAALPQRSYPQGGLGGEFLGFVGEVNKRQLHEKTYRGVLAGELVGQSGVEATYDRQLNGGVARARVRVDSLGRTVGPLRLVRQTIRSRTLELTVDAHLQRAALKAIKDGIGFAHAAGHSDADAGAAVVLDSRTGAVKALASYPGFNQSLAARDPAYYAGLLHSNDPRHPLVDRATQGIYPTGSTFKPIVAEAALSAGLISPYTSLPCTGSLPVGNFVFHNVEPGINESMSLPTALEVSCDTWFYRLGTMFYARQQAGHLDMQNWAHMLGLGHPTGFDVPGEVGGVVPTPAWLRSNFREPWQRIWYEGYSVNLSIGQGYLAVTPLQLAVAYAALANGGTVVRPHVAKAVLDSSGTLVRRLRSPPRARLHLPDLWAIHEGLYAAAHSSGGTSAAIFGNFPIPVAGKTGTAQTPSGSDHSWYASWAPYGNPKIVVIVLIEHGGFGAEAAAPAAREIYQAYFHLKH